MVHELATACFQLFGARPVFRVHGKGRHERDWHQIDVVATHRRDVASRWPGPLWRGACITWTASLIAVGWDFAEDVLREQMAEPASREHPVEVETGRLRNPNRMRAASASEVLAHECGHTAQGRRMGLLYWPIGGLFTWWREGQHWWNWFENQASSQGLFGGIVNGSVCAKLLERVRTGE
jgi:hypothetical protein